MAEISLFLPSILLAYATYMIATGSLGPATLAIMGVSMSQGRSAGIIYALGNITGSTSWAALAAIGLTEFLKQYAIAITVVKILGGCYLLWMAFRALKSALSSDIVISRTDLNKRSNTKIFIYGLLLSLTNPKAFFGWLAVLAIGVQPDAPSWVVVSIVTGCALLGTCIFLLYAIIFSNQRMIDLYKYVRRPFDALMAGIFGFAGFKLLTYKIESP